MNITPSKAIKLECKWCMGGLKSVRCGSQICKLNNKSLSHLKSSINRVGGKAYLSQWLCSFLPEHLCYVEPFAGDVERVGFGIPSKGTSRNPAKTFRTAIDSLNIVADRLKNVTIELYCNFKTEARNRSLFG